MITKCPNCGFVLKVADATPATTPVSCPRCGRSFTLQQSHTAGSDQATRINTLRTKQADGTISPAERLELAHTEKQYEAASAAREKLGQTATQYDRLLRDSATAPAPAGDQSGQRATPAENAARQTQLLSDILDAIRALSGGYSGATGQAGHGGGGRSSRVADEKAYFTRAGGLEDALSVLSQESSSESQSGSSLAGFARGLIGLVRRRTKGYGGQRAGTLLGGHGIAFVGDDDPTSGSPAQPDDGAPHVAGGTGPPGGRAGPQTSPKNTPAAEATTGWAAWAAGGVAALGVAAIEAGKATYAFARAQEKEVQRLSQYGGQQALGMALLEAGRVRRDIQTAADTGGSSQGLTEAIDNFEQALRPIEVAATNLANTVGSGILELLTAMLTAMSPIAEAINEVVAAIREMVGATKKADMKIPFDDLTKIAAEARRLNNPNWPGGPVGQPQTAGVPFPAASGGNW